MYMCVCVCVCVCVLKEKNVKHSKKFLLHFFIYNAMCTVLLSLFNKDIQTAFDCNDSQKPVTDDKNNKKGYNLYHVVFILVLIKKFHKQKNAYLNLNRNEHCI